MKDGKKAEGKECPECNGTGQNHNEMNRKETFNCLKCQGSGKVPADIIGADPGDNRGDITASVKVPVEGVGKPKVYKFIKFVKTDDDKGKGRFTIMNKKHGDILGEIFWYSLWRCYVTRYSEEAVFSSDCELDIVDFKKSLI